MTGLILASLSPRFDLSALLMLPLFYRLPCFAGRHRPVRAPRCCLTRRLPSLAPLSSRVDYTHLLGVSRRSWYRIVVYPADLVFLVFVTSFFSLVECTEGCWRVRIRPNVVSSMRKTDQIHRRISCKVGRTCSDCLLVLQGRSELWRRLGIRVLLQQQLYSSSSGTFYDFEYVRT